MVDRRRHRLRPDATSFSKPPNINAVDITDILTGKLFVVYRPWTVVVMKRRRRRRRRGGGDDESEPSPAASAAGLSNASACRCPYVATVLRRWRSLSLPSPHAIRESNDRCAPVLGEADGCVPKNSHSAWKMRKGSGQSICAPSSEGGGGVLIVSFIRQQQLYWYRVSVKPAITTIEEVSNCQLLFGFLSFNNLELHWAAVLLARFKL